MYSSVNYAQPPLLDAFTREVAAFGGRIGREASSTGMVLAESRSVRHALSWAPLLGGEHHAIVPFCFRSSVILALREGGPTWFAGPDETLAGWLRGALYPLAARLAWTTTVAPGAPPLRLEWAVQLRAIGGGFGHLVLRAGDYGGRSGLAELFLAVDALGAAIGRPEPHVPQAFLASSAFADAAARAFGVAPDGGPAHAGFAPASGRSIPLPAAAKVVSAVSAQFPDPDDEYSRRTNAAGRALLGGKVDEFIAIWQSVARDLPSVGRPGEAFHQIGAGYYTKKDYARAVQHYELALRAGYDDVAEVQKDIADARRKMG
jgi:hypothetical protein